jgi:hypothetical protein
MGLNNPQEEAIQFSLRNEALRIGTAPGSDDVWRQYLRSAAVYQNDLWQVPEFRQYCRPFSSATNGPQPGLVISFGTSIRANQNFFGWPLAGGDNTYDPTVYATKIDTAGIWYANYDVVNLSATPRVYLVPAGQDIMIVPNDPDLAVRVWNVLDQVIPVPYPSISSYLSDPTWRPLTDSVDGPFGQTKRFSSFLTFGFDHAQLTSDDIASLSYNARLVGRSAWNTRWLLIIPGATLNADPKAGLDNFINSVTDINLILSTYGFSGN